MTTDVFEEIGNTTNVCLSSPTCSNTERKQLYQSNDLNFSFKEFKGYIIC